MRINDLFTQCFPFQRYYIGSARELARLCGVCKAPIIQHFSETLSGSITIRSFDQQPRFHDTSMRLIDGYSRPNFHTAGAMEWLCIRLDVLSLFTFAFSLIFLISLPKGAIDPSEYHYEYIVIVDFCYCMLNLVKVHTLSVFSSLLLCNAGVAGLAVTYGLNLNTLQSWVVWNLCFMENKIISVERILQYTSIPSEPPLVVESDRPESDWPIQGEVNIQDLQVIFSSGIINC